MLRRATVNVWSVVRRSYNRMLSSTGLYSRPVPEETSHVHDIVPSPFVWSPCFPRSLPAEFFRYVKPHPLLDDPRLVCFSERTMQYLGLEESQLRSSDFIRAVAGSAIFEGTQGFATAYAGHQFGSYTHLGDGRALIIGEAVASDSSRQEIQLKGSGRTPYSRSFDGRAVLRSTIREYLCSEAMDALGIPTTRALCVLTSNDRVQRERIETAAILVRVAPSHIRFGTFELFAHANKHDHVRSLADFVIDQYFPQLRAEQQRRTSRTSTTSTSTDAAKSAETATATRAATSAESTETGAETGSETAATGGQEQPPAAEAAAARSIYSALFMEITKRTAELIAKWQSVGFVHGVMNTDNMSALGLTLDYGPFAFMERYDPLFAPNHSDPGGRYSFSQQPHAAFWNLKALAIALSAIAPKDELLSTLQQYDRLYNAHYIEQMRAKLGLGHATAGEGELILDLLRLMREHAVDYTTFFRTLSRVPILSERSVTTAAPAYKAIERMFTKTTTTTTTATAGSDDKSNTDTTASEKFQQWWARYHDTALHDLEQIHQQQHTLHALLNDEHTTPPPHYALSWAASEPPAVTLEQQDQERQLRMRWCNPKFVLRTWVAQEAIAAAERGDYSVVQSVNRLLRAPYEEHGVDDERFALPSAEPCGELSCSS